MTIVKICKKHGKLTLDDVRIEKAKWKTKEGETKITDRYRCAQCRRDTDKIWKIFNRDKHNASASRAKKEARRLYREGLTNIEPRSNIWAKEDRKKNPEKYKERSKKAREKLGQLRNTREVCRIVGIEVDEYYKMLKAQDGKCAICRMEETRKSRTEGKICALSIDHCHKKNKVRELLCHDCNTGLGKFKDDISFLKSAISYLEKHEHAS